MTKIPLSPYQERPRAIDFSFSDLLTFPTAMKLIHVCVVGDTLFADNVGQLLLGCERVGRLDRLSSLSEALQFTAVQSPNLLILVDTENTTAIDPSRFPPMCLDIPVICAANDKTTLKLITTRQTSARLSELLRLVTTLRCT